MKLLKFLHGYLLFSRDTLKVKHGLTAQYWVGYIEMLHLYHEFWLGYIKMLHLYHGFWMGYIEMLHFDHEFWMGYIEMFHLYHEFWMSYIEMLHLYHEFSASRFRLDLYIFCLPKITNLIFAFNHHNYVRWLVLFYENLLKLKITHPEIHHDFKNGCFSLKRTKLAFSRL